MSKLRKEDWNEKVIRKEHKAVAARNKKLGVKKVAAPIIIEAEVEETVAAKPKPVIVRKSPKKIKRRRMF